MKRYDLSFVPRARRAWDKLGFEDKHQLGRRLAERQADPRVASAKLRRMPDCYKIKLRSAGLRLIYKVIDDRLVILVLAVGKRERDEAYVEAARELERLDDAS